MRTQRVLLFFFFMKQPLSAIKIVDSTRWFPLYLNSFVDKLSFSDFVHSDESVTQPAPQYMLHSRNLHSCMLTAQ